jgi:hypothetical protein
MSVDDITIRFADIDDADKIMMAIKNHWDANHILALNKDFFLYIFAGDKNSLNFVIAEDKNTDEIAGFLGYIRYTSSLPCDIGTVMWQALEGKGNFLGLKMFLFLVSKDCFNHIFSIGINPKTIPIYQYLRYYIGKLDHYYRIMDKKSFMIAEIKSRIILPVSSSEFEIVLVNDIFSFRKVFEFFISSTERIFPIKDINYFCHRFFEHPVYSYKIFFINSKRTKESKAFFVCREVEQFETKVLRIVDFIGDEEYFAGISMELQNLMDQNNYEYIDCYSYGISGKTMNRAGFVKRIDDDSNIIPNYFEPFTRKNVDIWFFINRLDNIRLLKADADQDQPRIFKGII